MASILFKWFFSTGFILLFSNPTLHPIYVSVVEIEHNMKDKTLEVSCKLFTDDFEKALRSTYKTQVDLINPKDKTAMDRLVNDYVQKHLKFSVNGRPVSMKFIGYEKEEEGIYSYYEVEAVPQVQQLSVVNNLLYEYHAEQIGLMHITVNGNRKSTRLNNPNEKAILSF